jgi:hypothetical protein
MIFRKDWYTVTTPAEENPRETLACLIIDDPLLRPKYGCLNYEKLLEEMKVHDFFTEIAFIPWNYRRSDAKTVRLLADNADYYAICVHGCNHIGNEFGGENYRELSDLASTALWRMEQHKTLTDLPYDPVIVFPQGRFSSLSMQTLKDHGYFAAFNSTIRATDREEPPAIEYQRPFTTIYHDFPLFLRRYPKHKIQFVQDITAGRPIIIVEHHGAFRNGYKTMTDLVDWVNSLGNIRWTSLLHIAEHYLGKKAAATEQSIMRPPSRMLLNCKVALRRFLSEARDNHVETNSLLTKAYTMVRSWDIAYVECHILGQPSKEFSEQARAPDRQETAPASR